MNDGYRGPQGHDPYRDPYAHGYDPYGEQGYDYDQQGAAQDPGGQGYRDPSAGYGYDYDPYAQPPPQAPPPQHYPAQAPHPQAPHPQAPHPQAPHPRAQQHYAPHAPPPAVGYDYDYDPYGPAAASGEQPVTPVPPDADRGRIPHQRPPDPAAGPGGGPPHEPREYATEQFSFVEDETESSEDVIDWLKFTESRTERREEAKRRGRNRRIALLLAVVLAVLGGGGYLWATDRLPFMSGGGSGPAAAGKDQRDTLVVHLHDTDGGGSATALLVNNATTGQGTTVLLPNDLAVSGDDGTATTLGQAVDEQGAGATRDAIDALLGSHIKGSWRLDTPYLEILVEGVGGITLDADATVPGAKKGDDPLVEKGRKQRLNGEAAIAYATHLADGEPQTAQLRRFGQVMHAVLKNLPSAPADAKSLVKSMGMVLDPSLSEAELAASLASLSELAKEGAYATETLEVGDDGRPSERGTEKVVEDVLGGTVKNPAGAAAPRVSVQNGAGGAEPAEEAKVALVNGGFTVVDGGQAAEPAETSEVRYADAAAKEQAVQVAKTLGLPEKAVAEGRTPANADVTVVLGEDYEG